MKNKKILLPLLTIASPIITIAPTVTLTSCSNSAVETQNFQFLGSATDKKVSFSDSQQYLYVREVQYQFKLVDSYTAQFDIKKLTATAVITSNNQYFKIAQCYVQSYDETERTVTLIIDAFIKPSAFDELQKTSQKQEIVYDIKLSYDNWIQTTKDFSFFISVSDN